jgi:hypothetical protein
MIGSPVRLCLFPCIQNSLGVFPEANCGLDRKNPPGETISALGEKFYLGDTPNFESINKLRIPSLQFLRWVRLTENGRKVGN